MIYMAPDQPDITKDEVKILFCLYSVKNENKNELTKTAIKVMNDDVYKSMTAKGLIISTPHGKTYKYKISPKGIAFYESNKDVLSSIQAIKTSTKTGRSQANNAEILEKLDAMDKKFNERFDLLISLLSKTSSQAVIKPDTSDGIKTFEIAIKEEYKKLKERDFLGDGSVWFQELKKIVMSKYGYQDYQFDEMLQALKIQKLGMISMSQGKEKTWIEIKD